jgi:Lin1244/Lin1753-like, N-terminal
LIVKWFQLDADAPDDPKIRAVVRALGVEGFGGLVGLWCHVARHGRKPGQAIDSRGAPFPVDDLIAATGLPAEKFNELVELCTRSGHFRRDVWEMYRGIWIPAMERRADRYAKRLAKLQQIPIDWTGAQS